MIIQNNNEHLPFYIVINRYTGLTDGTHYPSDDPANDKAKSLAITSPGDEFFVCMVCSTYKIITCDMVAE